MQAKPTSSLPAPETPPKSLQTYYLNAEDLYVDNYWADGSGTYNNMYLYKVSNGNDYGKYYHIGSSWTAWWDSNDEVFLNEDDKDSKSLGYLEDYVYQVNLPSNWWMRHQYVRLNSADQHKYENNQQLSSTNPGGSYLDLDFEAMVDGAITPNTETQALMDYWSAEYGRTIQSATLDDYYVYDTLTFGYRLYLYDDNDASYITNVYMPSSSNFWKITSMPYQGTIFVNDNHPNTMFYYSHYTGAQVGGPGANIQDIDLTDGTYFDHHTNEAYFQDESRTYGSTTIDFTSSNVQNQITAVDLAAPILTDTVHINKNTGAIRAASGANTVEITIDLMVDDQTFLFPMGATYRDYTANGGPTRNLGHLIVVDDSVSDPDQNKNELVANGRVYMYNHVSRDYEGDPVGWGTNGPAPEPADGMSIQAYFDGSRYRWGDQMTIGTESPGVDNSVAAPAYGSVDVVLNEINPAFIELYNRGGTAVSMSGWKVTGEGDHFTMSGSIGPGGYKLVTEAEMYIPFTPGTGGRVSLFDDLGVLVSSIGYQTDVAGNQQSYTARHLDGMGPDYGYNESMTTPWAQGVAGAQKNGDWEINIDRTTDSENYKGLTFLQIGTIKDSDWSLVENLSNYNADWTDGSFGVKKIDQIYINNFDVVFCLSGLSGNSQWILDDYVNDGGRLYVETGDWTTLDGTDFYRSIGLSAGSAS
ncbi:MAG: lamin tail domain-containing protein, partial [Planctomycetes bacterium]|nr:lamin tail domain-containing protein [Planctomycetota bacterium]